MDTQNTARERIVRAAAALLEEGGREAVSTRAVSAAAKVQPPAIYRLFGDMQGLLDAVTSHGIAEYLRTKTQREHAADPVEDLRRGWDLHVEFGLAHPALYTLLYGNPRPGVEPPAAREAGEILAGLVHRVAEAGRLRVGVDEAARMIHSAGCGVTLTLIAAGPGHRDPHLSPRSREAVLAAVTTGGAIVAEAPSPVPHAVALKAALPAMEALTPAEKVLLGEWLDRLTRPAG
ncbi:TetR/AcrR family transcriptional regulator [Actinomadura rugatobispora]|uniref:TetR/AcrR family transcriptional regulator n=1 Tax=Actinomadura rugatobispora TaxID=1994 RepID=A0ABW0ZT86_9ACTN|nr:TetR/AcrR family transcriptional regulator [Actinomadura rugatobispora]